MAGCAPDRPDIVAGCAAVWINAGLGLLWMCCPRGWTQQARAARYLFPRRRSQCRACAHTQPITATRMSGAGSGRGNASVTGNARRPSWPPQRQHSPHRCLLPPRFVQRYELHGWSILQNGGVTLLACCEGKGHAIQGGALQDANFHALTEPSPLRGRESSRSNVCGSNDGGECRQWTREKRRQWSG